MFAVYISHPQVRIDPAVPVPEWRLSDRGRKRAVLTAKSDWIGTISRFVSSAEVKAVETAAILAHDAVRVEIHAGMGENDRSATGFLDPKAFEKAADWFFANPERSFQGWERAVDAQTRIVSEVRRILDVHDASTPIAFVGHGGVGTLLKCHLLRVPISRSGDQPPGGGNLFAFRLADLSLACDWTAMESWQGWTT